MATTPTPAQQLGADFHDFLTSLGQDVLAGASGLLANFGKSISATPTEANLVAQVMLFSAAAPLALPALESAGIKQFGGFVVQASALLPALLTPAATPAS